MKNAPNQLPKQSPLKWPSNLPILVDPINKTPLAEDTLNSKFYGSENYFNLIPSEGELKKTFRDKYDIWKILQAEGETSYQTDGPIGNFSHKDYGPGIALGKVIQQYLNEDDKYLDIGCGLLEVPVYIGMQDKKDVFIGMDPIANGLPSLYKPRNFPFLQGIGDCIPFPNNSFNGVIFSSTLDHHIDPAVAIAEATRVTKKNGLIFIVETMRPKNLSYYIWKIKKLMAGVARYNRFHAWAFTKEDLLSIISKHPLKVELTKDLGHSELLVVSRKLI